MDMKASRIIAKRDERHDDEKMLAHHVSATKHTHQSSRVPAKTSMTLFRLVQSADHGQHMPAGRGRSAIQQVSADGNPTTCAIMPGSGVVNMMKLMKT
jgi:hypothetical protein